MVTSNGPAEEELSRCLLSAVQQPIRAHFTLLTWDGVLQKVDAVRLPPLRPPAAPLTSVPPSAPQLSEFNPKAKKLETLPPFYEVGP